MHRSLFLLATCLWWGCAKEIPPAQLEATAEAATVALRAQVDVIEGEIAKYVAETDEQLWGHWINGTALEFPRLRAAHSSLWEDQTLRTIREGHRLNPDDARLVLLERWLVGERLAQMTAEAADAVTQVEATATFMVEGKTYAFRDLLRVLANEKSAVKRKAIWAASHGVALQLETALVQREKQLSESLVALALPPPLEFAAWLHRVDVPTLEARAKEALARTDTEWKAALERLATEELKLAPDTITRADLPRLLKSPADVDAQFPKDTVVARGQATLKTLGLEWGNGLTLDSTDSALKPALPLTVAPRAGDIRVSVKPQGGLRDQQALLRELGVALAFSQHRGLSFTEDRLFDPLEAQRLSELMSTLVMDERWLEQNGIGASKRVAATAKAQQLFMLRRAAGLVLSALQAREVKSEDAARAHFVATMSRALGVAPSAEDGARWKIETTDFLRAVTQLLAIAEAETLRDQWGDDWWKKPLTAASSARPSLPQTHLQ